MAAKSTPLMQQHAAAKRAYPDAIVFFRLGDFYEMFGEDAVLTSRLLNLTLTSRNKGAADEIPMAGVPHHSAHGYVGRLLEMGYQVAICEQMGDPKLTKGIVPREVVRVLTPGLVTAEEHLEARENNWLAALSVSKSGVGVALLDLSTAELRAAKVSDVTRLMGELARRAPREVLLGLSPDLATDSSHSAATHRAAIEAALPGVAVRDDGAIDEVEQNLALDDLARDADTLSRPEREAVARALRFARRCNPGNPLPVLGIGRWDPSSALVIDPNAQRHLELVAGSSGDKKTTLLGVVDETATPAGARLLRQRLLAPSTLVAQIRRWHDRVETLVVHAALRERLRTELAHIGDLERIVSRVQLGEASPKDLGQLRDSLAASAAIVNLLQTLNEPAAVEALGTAENIDTVPEVCQELQRALVESPPALAKEGAIFLPEYSPELAELEHVQQNAAGLIAALETRLREQTGIPTLKARFTRVFGWYLEVSRSAVSKVPQAWRRKQTVATGERYTMDELDALADRIAGAEEQHRTLELELLRNLNAQVATVAPRIRALSERIAAWDVDSALAEVAHRYDYCRPEVNDGTGLEIHDGRHPVVERLSARGRFVPNDVEIDAEGIRLWIVTGPNMAGKSTLLRQVALISILAQMGSFVPARSAQIGVVDRVLSRVGANDNLAQGQSTFMVEMKETAEILRHATPRSLVILDEIGRGTSTFDGLAIAWAVAEHLDDAGRCRALFATHYHELTRLAEESPHVANYSVSAREHEGDIVFLHRLVPGAASRSYGVAVARLAGLPEAVLARADALLAQLEGKSFDAESTGSAKKSRRKHPNQLGLFQPVAPAAGPPATQTAPHEQEILETLRALNVERLSPLEALQLLDKLKRRL